MTYPNIHDRIRVLEAAADMGEEHVYPRLDELRADRNEQVFHAAVDATSTLVRALLDDLAPKLTCIETEAVAELYRTLGANDTADRIVDAHSYGDDDPDDAHYDPTKQEG